MATATVNVKGKTSIDQKGWAAGLRKMETSAGRASRNVKRGFVSAIGGVFAAGAIVAGTKRMIDHADAIDKMAKRMETSTDTAQRFDFAASQNGATMQQVEAAYVATARAMGGAEQGLTTYVRAFQEFGITLDQIRSSTPEEIFLNIAKSIQEAGGALDRAKSLQDIMGRSGRFLTPAFVSGFAETAQAAPAPIDEEHIKNLARFKDELDRLTRESLPALAAAVSGVADVFQAAQAATSDEDLRENFWKNQAAIYSAGLYEAGPGIAGFRYDIGDLRTGPASEEELEAARKRFGVKSRSIEGRRDFTAELMGLPSKEEFIGPKLPTKTQESDLQKIAQTQFIRPDLQLNQLQRMGAAVTQSTKPVEVEVAKDTNQQIKQIRTLMKRVEENTRD